MWHQVNIHICHSLFIQNVVHILDFVIIQRQYHVYTSRYHFLLNKISVSVKIIQYKSYRPHIASFSSNTGYTGACVGNLSLNA